MAQDRKFTVCTWANMIRDFYYTKLGSKLGQFSLATGGEEEEKKFSKSSVCDCVLPFRGAINVKLQE
jgi:hypothetical protein